MEILFETWDRELRVKRERESRVSTAAPMSSLRRIPGTSVIHLGASMRSLGRCRFRRSTFVASGRVSMVWTVT